MISRNPLCVVFRTDASIQIGTGHVMRCLTLAEELTHQGHNCHFVCREHPGHLGDLIASKGHSLKLLPAPKDNLPKPESGAQLHYARWLGVPWQDDARQTLDALKYLKPDWLVVDHYALDAHWERTLSSAVEQIMVVDDLANRSHVCTILLDQNVLYERTRMRYQNLVNEDCMLVLGPENAILRPEYSNFAKVLPERDGVIARVLIFVGGSDPYHLTEQYLEALSVPEFHHLYVDVVIGKNHPSPKAVEKLIAARSKTRLYYELPSLAALMVRSDLMLGAGGSTNWERMCLGLYSIVVSVADNQNEINTMLANNEFIHFLGKIDQVSSKVISDALRGVIRDPLKVKKISNKSRILVDGEGTKNIVTSILKRSVL